MVIRVFNSPESPGKGFDFTKISDTVQPSDVP